MVTKENKYADHSLGFKPQENVALDYVGTHYLFSLWYPEARDPAIVEAQVK